MIKTKFVREFQISIIKYQGWDVLRALDYWHLQMNLLQKIVWFSFWLYQIQLLSKIFSARLWCNIFNSIATQSWLTQKPSNVLIHEIWIELAYINKLWVVKNFQTSKLKPCEVSSKNLRSAFFDKKLFTKGDH